MRPVYVAPAAFRDLDRLVSWLAPRSPRAADAAADALAKAIAWLAELPGRGRPVAGSIRELPVKFGRYGYAVRYQVTKDAVRITRLRQVRERP